MQGKFGMLYPGKASSHIYGATQCFCFVLCAVFSCFNKWAEGTKYCGLYRSSVGNVLVVELENGSEFLKTMFHWWQLKGMWLVNKFALGHNVDYLRARFKNSVWATHQFIMCFKEWTWKHIATHVMWRPDGTGRVKALRLPVPWHMSAFSLNT